MPATLDAVTRAHHSGAPGVGRGHWAFSTHFKAHDDGHARPEPGCLVSSRQPWNSHGSIWSRSGPWSCGPHCSRRHTGRPTGAEFDRLERGDTCRS